MPRLAVLLKGYPRLSETFIAQEILALQRAGVDLEIVSLRRPTDPAVHPVHREITAPLRYLPEYLHEAPARVLRGWWRARRLPGYRRALGRFLRDLLREPTANRLRRFGQACVAAAELPAETERLYVHFLHTPGSVARYAALMRGLPWSASAHARDIWTTPEWEKREKLAELDWLVTCTEVGRAHLAGLAAPPDKVALLYHGLDLSRFPPPPAPPPDGRAARDGGDAADPVRLLSVGRAVEKKGYDDLLEALARLPATLSWRLTHIGGGALAASLKQRAEALGLAGRIEWLGPRAQEEVIAAYRAADLFVLASREAGDGDRDGLPNVLMEAQSQGLACLSTRFSAIPELIVEGRTGRLVPPGDPAALAGALAELIADPQARARLGRAGAERVRRDFDFQANVARLVERLAAPAALAAQ
ncbi:Glycosyltransferase involved in cell wall bisynthesis [Tistlia consotensis]|uniref:Glycosyltransferase involved in cell wall bisynthesis n=1 Tax=Tistlia consotensis USBA 355 TaxID=560819 RepID=A0A1Y6BL96_9PROT|nr:glycosyltransferase family 4 protein [Tistlia consotensis]SMF09380.1 Glycosyltransferase involved in cell wall bisynthesis [Tistlia consotensis USBA 355]SNR34595.1 Glycosyltransferase involved in cell wall bisynthesis [Tistlia consotensis]